MIAITLFGQQTVTDSEGCPLTISRAKSQGLLACLALNTEFPPIRDRLMELFWGDRFTDQARQSLRQAIAKLKKALVLEDAVLVEGDRVGLNRDLVRVDVDTFAALVQDPSDDATAQAVALMTGPVLYGIYGRQAEFEDWLSSERQRFSNSTHTRLC